MTKKSFMDRAVVRLQKRRSKIVATLGPATADTASIKRLIELGVNVFRLNMSHGEHAGHALTYELIRAASKELAIDVTVLADLCGPKIRVGRFEGGSINLTNGATVRIRYSQELGIAGVISTSYPHIARDVEPGSRILLDDGNLELKVIARENEDVFAEVVTGGVLKDRKGMNMPDSELTARAPTAKDLKDAAFACELGADVLALSFVRSAQDIVKLRVKLPIPLPVIAKIEMPEALDEIEAIVAEADGVMVARGDLGVELAAEDVPIVQDRLVDMGRTLNKPVIVATQMLDSMMRNPRPTRAEVTDISHAVWRGADAVMLSGETAAGSFPFEAVLMMDKVARRTEGYMWAQGHFAHIARLDHLALPVGVPDSFAKATAMMSRDLQVRAIIVVSRTGRSANIVSSARPAAPILALSAHQNVCRCMNLLWGVIPFLVDAQVMTHPLEVARKLIIEQGLAKKGDHFLLVKGFSRDAEKDAPSVTILQV